MVLSVCLPDMQQYNVMIEEVATVNRFCKAIGEAVIVAEVRMASGSNGRCMIAVSTCSKRRSSSVWWRGELRY